MNIMKTLLILANLALMASCALPNPHPMDMTVAIQSAKTKADHEALAVHYEQIAHDMKAMSEDHKRRLIEYQVLIPEVDEQHAQFVDHCLALIKIYAQAENENLELARLHHQIASRFPI